MTSPAWTKLKQQPSAGTSSFTRVWATKLPLGAGSVSTDAVLLLTNRSAFWVCIRNAPSATDQVPGSGSRTHDHCEESVVPLNASLREAMRWPTRSIRPSDGWCCDPCPGCAAGAAIGWVLIPDPPFTVGQPFTQSIASSSTGRLLGSP